MRPLLKDNIRRGRALSAEARRAASALKSPFIIGPLHRLELRNALRLAVFRQEITIAQCHAVLANIEADIASGVLAQVAPSWAELLEKAEAFSAAHTIDLGTRTMDIVHVAAAVTVGARDFYTYNARQASLAKKAGLRVRP